MKETKKIQNRANTEFIKPAIQENERVLQQKQSFTTAIQEANRMNQIEQNEDEEEQGLTKNQRTERKLFGKPIN